MTDVHVVVRGDTLCSIARRYAHEGVTLSSLLRANRSVITAPDRISVGMRVRLREGTTRSVTMSASRSMDQGPWMAFGCLVVGAGALAKYQKEKAIRLREEDEMLRLDRERQKTHWMRALTAEPGVVRVFPDEEEGTGEEDAPGPDPNGGDVSRMQRKYLSFLRKTKADTSKMALPGKENDYADEEERRYFT